MPCASGGPTFEEMVRAEMEAQKKQLDLATRLLCDLIKALPQHQPLPSVEIERWWTEHQREDAARVEREERTKKAAEYEKQMRISRLEAELQRLKDSK